MRKLDDGQRGELASRPGLSESRIDARKRRAGECKDAQAGGILQKAPATLMHGGSVLPAKSNQIRRVSTTEPGFQSTRGATFSPVAAECAGGGLPATAALRASLTRVWRFRRMPRARFNRARSTFPRLWGARPSMTPRPSIKTPGAFRLGSFRGAPIDVHWSAVLGMFLFSGADFAPAHWLAWLLIVLVHEMGHAVLVRRYRLRVLGIVVHGIGGECVYMARAEPVHRRAEPDSARATRRRARLAALPAGLARAAEGGRAAAPATDGAARCGGGRCAARCTSRRRQEDPGGDSSRLEGHALLQ